MQHIICKKVISIINHFTLPERGNNKKKKCHKSPESRENPRSSFAITHSLRHNGLKIIPNYTIYDSITFSSECELSRYVISQYGNSIRIRIHEVIDPTSKYPQKNLLPVPTSYLKRTFPLTTLRSHIFQLSL